ncbi:DUF4767 domain-containing protein [Lacticaseibacillus parakribbianus]|uniref:DUF4767 domain-containing protein n=1 Tax=Lacticaseibacillus parakribbianus TaxID=2970927 RepID=UPI0021CB8FBE|nr:DUF4767 domain-containing protein [Lacticaseibacillus parakribbianus]
MLKIWRVLVTGAALLSLAACSPRPQQGTEAASGQASVKRLAWNATKAKELTRFVTAWGNQQGFVYHRYTQAQNGTYYSDAADMPNALIDGNLIAWRKPGASIKVAWVKGNQATADYTLLAAYCNDSNAVLGQSQLLLFTIRAGQPQVLATKQERSNAAGTTVFTPPADAALTKAFKDIWRSGTTAVPDAPVAPIKDIHAATAILQRASVEFAPTKTPIQWNTERIVNTSGGPYHLNVTQPDGSLTVACLDGLHDRLLYRLTPLASGRVRIEARFSTASDSRPLSQLSGYTIALDR